MLQPDTDNIHTDLLLCPRAICTIPKDNTAAAKAPTYSNSEEAKPMALSLEGWGGDSKRKGRNGLHLGVGSDEEAEVHTEMRLCEKV